MAELVISCPKCQSHSRVPEGAWGQSALCPACGTQFPVTSALAAIARSAVTEPPTVYPIGHDHRSEPGRGILFGLALSSFLLPLVWLLLPRLGARSPVFTLGLPLAIAFGASGLGVGIAFADRLRFSTRVKGLMMLLGLTWVFGTTFFFLKAEWIEAVRKDLGFPTGPWYTVAAADRLYKAEMPGLPQKMTIEVVEGWRLDGFRYADRKDKSFAFALAHGKPKSIAGKDDAQFFDEARAGATAIANGTLLSERPLTHQGQPGREYVFRLADQATNRTVRIYHVGSRAVVAMAEGAFLPPDARDVRRFFDSLVLFPDR